MTAFNVVRIRVKPGREQEFLDAHRNVQTDWPGLRKINKAYAHASLHVLLRAEAKARFCAFHNRLVKNPQSSAFT
jgi:hypothetical protein